MRIFNVNESKKTVWEDMKNFEMYNVTNGKRQCKAYLCSGRLIEWNKYYLRDINEWWIIKNSTTR